MVSWFGRGKPEHPLADTAKVEELISKLPATDSARALGEVAGWLELMNRAEDMKLEHRFRSLDLLDAASRTHEHALLVEYLATPRQKKSHEHKLWTSAYGLWRELGQGYQQCFRECEKDRAASRANLSLYIGRALRALRQQLRWALLRYESAEQRVWSELAGLYKVAEAKGATDQPVAIYPGSSGSGTVKQELLKALMLSASSTDSLHPVGQDIAARVVSHFSGLFAIAREPDEGSTHWFDLGAGKPPVRLVKNAPDADTIRYIGAGAALRELEQLRAHIAYTRSLPEGLDLNGRLDDEVVLGLLKHLEQDWSGKTQARRFERRKVATRVTVAPGLKEIIAMLEFAYNDSLDFTQQQAAESWIVEDMSEGGYGAVIPAVAGDWVEVGTLVGVEGETFRDWRVGVVRRVTRNEQQQQRVGVELLSPRATLVTMRAPATGSADAKVIGQALLLSPKMEMDKDVGLVMGADMFANLGRVEIAVGEETHILRPSESTDRGADYEVGRFKVVRR
ncbi:MAG: hypothetical protein HY526_10445 [Betaproteobacteria bacterium]|nr:hypothetical protein [Betaproteobacteria bacterium]